jgi:hypothetical protein
MKNVFTHYYKVVATYLKIVDRFTNSMVLLKYSNEEQIMLGTYSNMIIIIHAIHLERTDKY